jgi:hypothetical protein
MSYIAFDLDALNVSRDVGAAAGVPEERITHGLLRMWAWCFREKTDTVQAIQVQGFFGTSAAPALVAFGFLAPAGADFRVRGAERYLRISDRQKKAGTARALVAGRLAGRFTSQSPATDQPVTSHGPALTPSTEHRAPSTFKGSAVLTEPPPKPPRKVKPTDPRHAPLVARLVEAFADDREAPYPFGPRDAKVVSSLLARAEPDVIVAAWERALRHQGFPSVATLAQLEQHLAQFVAAPRADVTRGYAPPSVFTETKEVLF